MKWIEFLENKLMRFVLGDVYWVDYEGFCSMIENISYRITKKNFVISNNFNFNQDYFNFRNY